MGTTVSTAGTTETTRRCDVKKVKVGSVFSRHSFGKVLGVHGSQIRLRNSNGFEWGIDENILEQEFSFADQFDKEEDVSRTRAIEILTEHSHTAMTVHFNKALDPKAVADALKGGQGTLSDKEWKKRVAEACAGEERVMIGHHSNSFDEHRRLHFVEMDKGGRLVDVRTVNWMIVNRVKYTVK